MPIMVEHVFDPAWDDAGQREWRQDVLLEEVNAAGFERLGSRATAQLAYEKDFIDVVRHRRVTVLIPVISEASFLTTTA